MSEALKQSDNAGAGHTAGLMRFYRPEVTQESNADFWCFDTGAGFIDKGIGFSVAGLISVGDARRLAACWNALRELTVEAIEAITAADIENVLIRKATAGRVAELEAVNAELVAACESWVQYFDRLTRDDEPGDKLADMRRKFHGERVEATRAALVKDAIVNRAALAAALAANQEGE